MGYNWRKLKMKKVFCILITFLCFSMDSQAQECQKIADGLYIVSYGNITVIEDDIHQQTLQLKVVKSPKGENSVGQQLYDFACGNKLTKDLTKTTMQAAITGVLVSLGAYAGTYFGNTNAGVAAGQFVAKYANVIASYAYDSACEYFKE